MKPGDVLAERFEIERRAGSGGMGEVFRALDRASGKPVALKVLLATQAAAGERFAREAKVLSELHHPSIVRYVAHGGTSAGAGYLAMEWLEGEDLARRIERGALDVPEALTLITTVAHALAAAHARGVIHRDLKPSNLFLVGGDVAHTKVLDFGIARLRGEETMTRTGTVLGTPAYMAPEQAQDGQEIDARADVFALGCVLFECLTGAPLFQGDHFMAILAKVLFQEAPRLSDLRPEAPAALDALVARMLSKDPAHRPSDGAALVDALVALGDAARVTMKGPLPSSAPVPSLTAGERRVLSVVLIGEGPPAAATAATLPAQDALFRTVETRGGRLSMLADGSAIVTFAQPSGVATDQAAQAARCALALRALAPDRPIALSTGRANLTGKMPFGDAIDRAAHMLVRQPAGRRGAPTAVDEVTFGLLDARFDVVETEAGLELRAEHELAEVTRTLLGKPTICVGRDRELGALDALLTECIEEPIAQAMLVTAPAGIGKSRLAHEAIRRARQRREGVQLWLARGDSLRAGSALDMLGQTLRSAFEIQEGEPIELRRKKVCARVASLLGPGEQQRVTELLGELVGAPKEEEGKAPLRAQRHDAELMSDRAQRAFIDVLRAETSAHPVLLVLEDLHWGDLPTVRFIDAALRELHDKPLMVLALARPSVHELFPKLWAERRVQELRLKELTRKASERLVQQVLGDSISAETMSRLLTLAEGHAFYLEELIRAVAEGERAALPETVLAMVQARLEGLDAEARRVLRAASVFGDACWANGVAELLGSAMGATQATTRLARLVEQEVLVRRPESRFSGEEELAFRHALLREGAYAMLTEEDRTLGHRLAGAWLERRGEVDPVVLAEHFERGGDRVQAARFYLRGVEQAHACGDTNAAITRARRALAEGLPEDLRLMLLSRLCIAYVYRPGLLHEVSPYIDEVMQKATAGSATWALAASAKIIGALHRDDHAAFLSALSLVQEVDPAPGAVFPVAAALVNAVYGLDAWGQIERAEPIVERLSALAVIAADHEPLAPAMINMLDALRAGYARDDPWEGLTRATAALARCRRINYPRGVEVGQAYVGMNLWFLGARGEAEEQIQKLGESDQEVGTIYRSLCHIFISMERGALDETRRYAERLIETARAQHHRMDEGRGRWALAEMWRRAGNLDAALREARGAMALLATTPLDQTAAAATLAAILLAEGRHREALDVAEGAAARVAAMGACGFFRGAALRLVHAEALHAAGRAEEARAVIAAARERLLAITEKIDDPAYKKTFLEDVPENARTIALAREWLASA